MFYKEEIKKLKKQLNQEEKLMSTISDRIDANTQALADIHAQLAQIIATPPSDHADLTKQLTQIQNDLGDTAAEVTATSVAAAAAAPETVTPTASPVPTDASASDSADTSTKSA